MLTTCTLENSINHYQIESHLFPLLHIIIIINIIGFGIAAYNPAIKSSRGNTSIPIDWMGMCLYHQWVQFGEKHFIQVVGLIKQYNNSTWERKDTTLLNRLNGHIKCESSREKNWEIRALRYIIILCRRHTTLLNRLCHSSE